MCDRMRGSGLKLCWKRFRFDIKNSFFIERVAKPWHRMPWMKSLSLEVLKKHADVALEDVLVVIRGVELV